MASCIQGYDEDRFATTVSRNFLCSICFNVLREPVLCPRNHHCFCRSCITKHLQNSQRCPTCADEMTVETLVEPQRMIKDMLNELNIHCVYIDRGCQEILQLQHLDKHEDTCGFTPAVCTNQGCGATLNQRDLIQHQSELCEFRKLKCHSCGEITKTLADIEKQIANVEKNMATNETVKKATANVETNIETCMKTIQTSMATNAENMERNAMAICTNTMQRRIANVENNMVKNETVEEKIVNVEKNVESGMENMEARIKNIQTCMATNAENVEKNAADMERKLEAVNNEVRELKTALTESFDVMKNVLVKMENKIEENTKQVRNTPSGDKENIIVAGGVETDSVEKFSWRERTWSPLQSLPRKLHGGTTFVYDNHVTIAGGYCSGYVDDMIKMNINPNPDLSMHWSGCPVKLPAKLAHHRSVLYNDHLMVTGGYNGNAVSDCIHEIQLLPPYAVKTLSRMPGQRQSHSTQLMDDNLMIVGGSTTSRYKNNLSSVVLYDIKKNKCKQLKPLPYEVSDMSTVRWGDNVVVIGGGDKHGKVLDKVIIYNVKTEQSHFLPSMRCERRGCTAVVIGNNIVVLGGMNEHKRNLKSVEAFNFESYSWQELLEMSQARALHAAVVV